MPKKDKHSDLETSKPSKTEVKPKKKIRAAETEAVADKPAKGGKAAKKEPSAKESPDKSPNTKTKGKKSSGPASSKEKTPKEKSPKPAKAKAAAAASSKPSIEISTDDIALRAYFIAERRQKMGWPGDSAGDWIEAERQLRQEKERALRGRRA